MLQILLYHCFRHLAYRGTKVSSRPEMSATILFFKCGNSSNSLLDVRPLMRLIILLDAILGGQLARICTWSLFAPHCFTSVRDAPCAGAHKQIFLWQATNLTFPRFFVFQEVSLMLPVFLSSERCPKPSFLPPCRAGHLPAPTVS